MNGIESLELNTVSTHERELVIKLNQSFVGEEFSSTVNNVQRNASHKGFRPGKMPKNMVMSFYGKEIKEKLIEKLVEKSFDFACKEKELIPVSKPKLEPMGALEQDKSFTYRASFQIKPKVSVPLYKGLAVDIKKFTYEEQDIDQELADLQQSMATFVTPTDRLAIGGCDLVECVSIVKVDGEVSPAYSDKNYSIPLFAENVPEDLKTALLNKKIDDEAVVNYTMPQEHQDPAIAGKLCEMHLTIKSFKERVLPKLDDDFAKDVSDKFKSLADLRESVKLRLDIAVRRRDQYFKENALTKALVMNNPLEVPPALVERMSLSLINRELETLEPKTADNLVKNHWQELWQSVQERALFRTQAELLIEALIQDLKIPVSDEEIASKIRLIKDMSRDDAIYAVQVEKALSIIEKEATISVTSEPLVQQGN